MPFNEEYAWIPARLWERVTTVRLGNPTSTTVLFNATTRQTQMAWIFTAGVATMAVSTQFALPASWDQGNLKWRIYWYKNNATILTVNWRIAAASLADNENIEQARPLNLIADQSQGTRVLCITDELSFLPATGVSNPAMITAEVAINDSTGANAYFLGARVEWQCC
jgi:hypothetical protein